MSTGSEPPIETGELMRVTREEFIAITQYQYLEEHDLLEDYKNWLRWKYIDVGRHTLPREALR